MNSAHSIADPFTIWEGPNQGITFNSDGYHNTTNKTEVSTVIANPYVTKTIIIGGQSNHASGPGPTTYVTVSPNSQNLNIYDGGIYAGSDPVLGCTDAYWITGTVPGSSVCMRLADRIINQGKALKVIVVPIAVGGTTFAQWLPATSFSLFSRISTAILRCRAKGLEPDIIIWGQGETDSVNNTPTATVTSQIQTIVQGIRGMNCNAPFYAGIFTMTGGNTNLGVRQGIINSVNSSLNIKLGFDCDTLTPAGGYRTVDGTHLTDSGLNALSPGWQQIILP